MKNFCKQKDIGLIDNCNLEEQYHSTKKLHLNNKGNRVFAKNIIHFIKGSVTNIDTFDEIELRHILKDKLQAKFSVIRDSGFKVEDLAHFRKYKQNKTKIDESFLDSQFKIDDFSNPHRIDRN